MSTQVNLQAQALWHQRVDSLGLRLEDSPLWPHIEQLYRELSQAGIEFHPPCFVANAWGCPDGQPVIGVPFFLVDPRIHAIEEQHADDLEEGERIMQGLRHEAGHAINYAYRLYDEPDWKAVFGDFRKAYEDDYLPEPFHRDFVQHLPGWYGQKHPDEDFAETFAVWLTPGLDWRARYAGTGALRKLEYVDRMMKVVGPLAPVVDPASVLLDPDEIAFTVAEFYAERHEEDAPSTEEIGESLDLDLRELFTASGIGNDAATLVNDRRRAIMQAAAAYTGARMYVVKTLLVFLVARLRALGLRAQPGRDAEIMIGITALVTALTANFLRTGRFTGY